MELIDVLNTTYQKRQALNQSYSQNAFARDLGVSPTALSQVLSGKRTFSPKNAQKISSALNLPIETVRAPVDGNPFSQSTQLKLDTFAMIADWYHFAILNLVEVDVIKSPMQVSKRLGIFDEIAEEALERLLKLGFIKKQRGCFVRQQQALDAGNDIPSEALKKHNREKMELAIGSLEKVTIDKRDVSSLTVTFDPKNMDKVKEEIRRFKKRTLNLSGSDQASEVYSLNIQFFPLSVTEKK